MKAGDVVLVRFPFKDVATTKKRPALLLAEATRARIPEALRHLAGLTVAAR